MDDEFPDPDDEYDLVYEDEYEVLKDLEEKSCRKQLNFSRSNTQGSEKQQSPPVAPLPQTPEHPADPIVLSQNGGSSQEANSKKRRIEDLFGDIADLVGEDFVDYEPPKKKLPRWNQPDLVIEAILAARKEQQDRLKHNPVHIASPFPKENKKDSISLRVPPWNFVAVTRCSDGQRLYVRLKSDNERAVVKSRPASGLLSVSYSQLKAEAEEIIVKSVERASMLETASNRQEDSRDSELWVDRYRPRSCVDLLSDATVNVSLLRWLKLWDKIVFNREPFKRKIPKEAPKFGDKKFVNKNIEGLDDKGFPNARLVLLSGPPGLGKTTLAHVAAIHSGYNVVEVNASDDRGTEAFRQALVASTQMKAVIGANPKPNCLILDEIDGAQAASIDILLKFIQGKLGGKQKKGKEKTKKESDGCRRPVICICNDPYAPSLRALRPVALMLPLPELCPSQLVDRLMEVLQTQGLKANRSALFRLVERSGCDIRACLGALQYMGSANIGDSFTVGLKDARKGIFESWRDILQIPRDSNGPLLPPQRVQKALMAVQGGETERLALGVFHNYPENSFRDQGMEAVVRAMEWFQFYDEVNTIVMSQQFWSIMPYLNHAFVAWHFQLAGTQNPKLTYPTTTYEMNQKLSKNVAILTALRRACGMDALALTLDVAPLLPDLLTPQLRSVSAHLYSTKERANLARLVNVMLDLGLTMVQDRKFDGSYEYNLEPNLEEIGIFPDCKTRRSLTYALKQLLAQELELERLRRSEVMITSSAKSASKVESVKVKDKEILPPKNPTVPNHLKTLQPVIVLAEAEVQSRDFFGRVISKSPQQSSVARTSKKDNISPGTKQALSKSDIWFKYKEGYSNAVRRTVKITDVL